MDAAPYRGSLEHLHAELVRLDLMLRRLLIVPRLRRQSAVPQEFRGLLVSEADIEAMLAGPDFIGEHWRQVEAAAPELKPVDEQLQHLRENIAARRKATEQAGGRLSLAELEERFALSESEVDLLLVALAPELDVRYETLYSYLQNDVTRKSASVDLALNAICRTESEKIFARRAFDPEAALMRFRLVDLTEEPQDRHPPLLRKVMRVDESVVRFLIDDPSGAPGAGRILPPQPSVDTSDLDPISVKALQNVVDAVARAGSPHAVIRISADSAGVLENAAAVIGHAQNRPVLLVPLAQLDTDPGRIAVILREAALRDAILAVDASADAEGEPHRPSPQEARLWERILDCAAPVLLLGPPSAYLHVPSHVRIWPVPVRGPVFETRRQAWVDTLAGRATDADVARLADAFPFGLDRIRQTAEMAYALAAIRNPSDPAVSMLDLMQAGRSLSTPHLARFATTVEPKYEWSDLVLPEDKLTQLETAAARIRHRRTVHDDWGFGRKLSRGKGVNILFTGPSGTGKTMAAEVLAKELGLNLFQVDLSSVISKYIGETEKHLSAIFAEAESTQSVLFFDECDALFGKRTEVKDAHDRYANIEVNFLLQRIEQYDGVVILATNLQRNIDEAFLRRMQEVVEFPPPDEALRERLWRSHMPKETPRAPDIDYGFLARQFELNGGSIRNVVLNAAFLAAKKSQPLGMPELIRSVRYELRKQGKLALRSDFGKYFDLSLKEVRQ